MRVLVGADSSDHGVKVAETAHRLFGDDAEYLVISVSPLGPPVGWSPGWGGAAPLLLPIGVSPTRAAGFDPPTAREADDLATRAGAHAAEVSAQSGLDEAESIGDVGDPAARILDAAHEHHVDVLVVGYHDRSWFSRLVTPSVSREVVRESDIPVLVVP
jgi:nucleotide-binding universal stress UspA family protein